LTVTMAWLPAGAGNRTWAAEQAPASQEARARAVEIHVFWSPGCRNCEPVEGKALKRLGQELNITIRPTYIDIDKLENYAKLVKIEQLLGVESQDLPAVLVGSQLIGGERTIKSKLGPVVLRVADKGERWPDAVDEILRKGASLQVRPEAAVKVYGIYFTLTACTHCRRPDHVVKYLKSSAPNLELSTHLKQDIETRILQEIVEERAGIPLAERGKRPRLVVGKGYLTDDGISDAAALKLVRQAEGADTPPWVVSESEKFAARKRLTRLFDSLTLGTMVVGGLLDGVNPCAFAVIVFFISYLAALGRARGELLAIGMSFILAVFATYLAIGLGLSELLGVLSRVPWLGRAISFVVAGLAFLLAAGSFYDLGLVMKRRPREILLQLPGVVKRRINVTIARRLGGAHRDAMKDDAVDISQQRRRIALLPIAIAALSAGVIVSILELACTGQIYLPAVRMMLFSASGRRLRALGYLVVYNLAFILPLIGVFVLAYAGVTSDQLRDWLNRHLGVTKFVMGVFFLLLAVIIVVIEF